jgi:hypothetical protein
MARTWHHGDKAKERRFGKNWHWFRSTPSWWNKLFHHKPARREERDKLVRGETENYPDHRKPHKYYW